MKGEPCVKYMDLYVKLKDAIRNGEYLQGSFLPTEMELMKTFRVSRTTVRRAMAILREEGLVNISRGRGAEVLMGKTRVRQTDYHIAHDVVDVKAAYLCEGKTGSSSSIIDLIKAEQKVEAGLKVPPMTDVYRIQRLKFCKDIPFDYVASYVPQKFAPGLEKFSGQVFWLNKCLHDEYGIVSTHVEERISAGTATFLEANMLHVSVGSPLIIVSRTAWIDDMIMEYTESRFRPDVFQITLSMSGKPDYLDMENERAMEIVSLL